MHTKANGFCVHFLLKLFYNACSNSLNLQTVYVNIIIFGVFRVKPENTLSVRLVKALERCLSVNESNDYLSFLCFVLRAHKHEVSVVDTDSLH